MWKLRTSGSLAVFPQNAAPRENYASTYNSRLVGRVAFNGSSAVLQNRCLFPYRMSSYTIPGSAESVKRLGVVSSSLSPHTSLYHTNDQPIQRFGYATDFEDRYEIGEKIGSGTFGEVYRVTEKETGHIYAVKRMPKRFGVGGSLDKYYVRRVRNEVDIGTHLGRSLNIAYLYEAFEDNSKVDIVMELCEGGTLWDAIIHEQNEYTEADACRLIRDIVRVVAQCHSQGVMIRDIKPENFLFSSKDRKKAPLKAIDFGVSVFCEPGEKVDMRAGTPMYVAPEVLKCNYGLEADIWSAGIVAYQLLIGKLPFSGEEGSEVAEEYMNGAACANKDIFRAILYSDMDFSDEKWSHLSPGAKDLVASMLQREPNERPSATQILQHEWLRVDGHKQTNVLFGDTVVQRLQRYGTYGMLKQAALRKMAHAASQSHSLYNALTKGLEEIGVEALPNGRVTMQDLSTVLEGGKFNLSPEEAEQLLSQVSFDGNGTVNPDDWIAAMTEWKAVRDTSEWDHLISEVFEAADIDHDESLGAEDLERLLCGDEGCDVEGLVDSAMREADSDGDGALSLGEFKYFMGNHDSDLELFDSRMNPDAISDSESAEGETE